MEIDRRGLSEEFDIEYIRAENKKLKVQSKNAEESLEENVERANRILEMVEGELNEGNFSARMVEVAGQIMNTITNANKEIITSINYKTYLQIREKLLQYKYDELKTKENIKKSLPNQNIIVTTREDVLKILNQDKKQIGETIDVESS